MEPNYKSLYYRAENGRKHAWCEYYQMRNWTNNFLKMVRKIKADEIGNFEHVKNQVLDLAKKANEFLECAICLEEMNFETKTKFTKCGHMFHTDCLNKVENMLCPICRAKL